MGNIEQLNRNRNTGRGNFLKKKGGVMKTNAQTNKF